MKKNVLYIFSAAVLLSSCIKQTEKAFTGKTVVEIDAAPLNSNAVGVSYPIFTRVLPEGRPIATAVDSTLRRFAKTVKVRLNLVGPQSDKDETVGYRIVGSPITTISFPATLLFSSAAGTAGRQEPGRAAATLNVSDAVAGTHYVALTGKVTIPAKSSFGYINIQVLEGTATAGQGRYIGIQLDSTGTLLPSVNYRQIGMVIDQR